MHYYAGLFGKFKIQARQGYTQMRLTKTDFIQYLNCPKSLWLAKRKPQSYPTGEFTDYQKKLAAEGYEVEGYVRRFLTSQPDADRFSFQDVFELANGITARADVVRRNENGAINIYEVKSSTSVKDGNPHNQLKDAAFQTVAAEGEGQAVDKIFIVHLNGSYVRKDDVVPKDLLVFENVTERVRSILDDTRDEIGQAVDLLSQAEINEDSCSCLYLSKDKHCDSFEYFNANVPTPSIYNIPRIHKNKIALFVNEGRFSLDKISVDEVSPTQAGVVKAAHRGEPLIDKQELSDFFGQICYPLYFLDYETYSSAIPVIEGVKPQSQLPFQFSLHIKRHSNDSKLEHVEFLAEQAELPLAFIEALQATVGAKGSIISWHKSFENTRNREMGQLFPGKSAFLEDVNERTIDLEEIFKSAYVDIRFGGSTSIKNVLPILAPDLSYEGKEVSSGTEAMDVWMKFVNQTPGEEKKKLRKALLEYCKLDTYAMVRIFEEMERIC